MKRLIRGIIISTIALLGLSACGGAATAKPNIPSARCAQIVYQASTGGSYTGIAACLTPSEQSMLNVKTDGDWTTFVYYGQYGPLSLYPGKSCGEYSGDVLDKADKVSLFKGTYVFAYSVSINPSTYPFVYPHSILSVLENAQGYVTGIVNQWNAPTECPLGHSGVAVTS